MGRTGLVLSGGGARGAAHLGVLKAIDELGIKVSAISGVSAGAVIGALYAAGHSPVKILDELKKLSYFGITDIAWMKNGLFTMAGLKRKLEELIGSDSFEGLGIPLFVTATDISLGQQVTFSSGALYDAIIASASVPVIFQPMHIKDYQLLDGGILNNFPTEPLLDICDTIIGSHVNKVYDGINPIRLSEISIVEQCFHLAIANGVRQRAVACTVFIEPLLAGYGMFDMKNADRIFEIGYSCAMEQKDKLMALASGGNAH